LVIKNRNLFRITRAILLKLPLLFHFFAKFRRPQKRLLIIKTDAIGDYVLFRNYIEIVKKSDHFNDYQVDLLGNTAWKDIALKYDAVFIDQFYFTSPYKLYEAPIKTLKLGWLLFKNNYDIVLQPSYTRTFINDGLAALTGAKQIIGFESDNEGIPVRYKIKTDKFYTQRLLLPSTIWFEFDRSRFFFESVLNNSIPRSAPSLPVADVDRSGIVIVPGAGVARRCWEPEKFLGLIKLIMQHTAHTVYVEGGNIDLQLEDYLRENSLWHRVINLMGKTTLTQFIDLIGKSALVIANETSAIHIAVATNTKSVCITGGGHFGRFVPYPDYVGNQPVCVYEKMPCYYCNWDCIYKPAENEFYPCICVLSIANVWAAALPLLS
jgi:ADP-heptose:LPS heptosyltransferase